MSQAHSSDVVHTQNSSTVMYVGDDACTYKMLCLCTQTHKGIYRENLYVCTCVDYIRNCNYVKLLVVKFTNFVLRFFSDLANSCVSSISTWLVVSSLHEVCGSKLVTIAGNISFMVQLTPKFTHTGAVLICILHVMISTVNY